MNLPRLYDDLAWLWPHLSPPSHYVVEADLINTLIAERRGPGGKRVLELGAGGGHTLVHLARAADGGKGEHECTAVDLSAPMLKHCRALLPGVEAVVADMRDVRLGQRFDVVLIHDAIDYLLTPEDVGKTLVTVREHLVPGGLALIAPTYLHETFVDGDVADDTAEIGDGQGQREQDDADAKALPGEVTYFSYVHDPDPSDDTFEMILLYLIRDQHARQVEVVEDRHTCGLFEHAAWMDMIEAAGLTAEYVEQGDPEEDEKNDSGPAWELFLGTRSEN